MNEKGQRIIALRKKGKTYGEIAEILNISKSTVAWWLRGVKIPKSIQKQILERAREKWRKNITAYNKIYAKIRSQKAAEIRENYKEKAAKEIKKISKRDLKLIGAALYWAEGNTKNQNRFQFSNSNPLIIKTSMRFLREICNIPDSKITARIHLYPGINYQKTLNFWHKITKLPKKNFKSPQIQVSRASKGKRPKNTLPYGTLHLTVNSTKLTCKVKGWIQGISEKI